MENAPIVQHEEATLTLRVPAALKARLEQIAETEHRTLSGQVRAILDEATRQVASAQGGTK